MKKSKISVVVCLLLLVAICMCSCSSQGKNNNSSSTTTFNGISNSTKYESSKESSNWELKNCVDEFGDYTSRKCLSYKCKGTFSNTATTDSDLSVEMIITPIVTVNGNSESIEVKLYEYGNQLVKYVYGIKYDVAYKTESTKSTAWGKLDSDTVDRVRIYELNISDFKTPQKIMFIITDRERPTTIYKFTIDTTGFMEVYNKLRNC